MKNLIDDSPESQIEEFKTRVGRVEQGLAARFWQGEDVEQLVRARTRHIDGFLTELWEDSFDAEEPVALIAVGGYGRGELHPHSDIDLLILIHRRLREDPRIAAFVRLLWDLDLDIGHSVRTVSECLQEAQRDVAVMTTLMERRLLVGSGDLASELDKVMRRRRLWPSSSYFRAKHDEQEARHDRWGDVEYGLEPDVKNSPGGLRDIQTVGWVTKRHFDASSVEELVQLEILTESERDTFVAGQLFLWRVRFALHLLAGRRQDHLVFDYQRQIADRFGYRDSEGLLAVECFMRDYYRHVLELREVNDILLQHFNEVILHRGREVTESVNERFQLCNGYIEAVDEQVFSRSPESLLEIFVLMANHSKISGVRASTIRLIRESLDLIDARFRSNPAVARLFIELLRSPYTLGSQLTRMRRYGILGRYIPAFGQVVGQMQHDLFHIYTVDAHTIMVIRHMRRFFMPKYRDDFPFVVEALQYISKVELLFLAGLFHDIAKGRGGDHSQLSAIEASNFCSSLGLSAEDRELVTWLVQHHLVLSTTAQRMDIDDPQVVSQFANMVGSERNLSYLVALTVADINATNPNLWNGWRASLISKLYRSARVMLRSADNDSSAVATVDPQANRNEAETALAQIGIGSDVAERIWTDSENSIVMYHNVDDTVQLTAGIHHHDFEDGPFVRTSDIFGSTRGEEATEVFVCAPNRPLLFANCVAMLDELQLQVVNARIVTGESQMCYDSFIVLNMDGERIGDEERKRQISEQIRSALHNPSKQRKRFPRRVSRQLTQFVRPATLKLTSPNDEGKSTLELVVSDRPGLLALIAETFVELDVELHEARIATLGERVEDLFVISDLNGKPLQTGSRTERIVDTLTERIDAAIQDIA